MIFAQSSKTSLDKGWKELSIDNDTSALRFFEQGYQEAIQEKNTEMKALSLLYLGIGSYGVSYSNGLNYAIKALDEYKKLDIKSPDKAKEGRSRCLQLISTINGRQGKFVESIRLSKEALIGFQDIIDTTGTVGLIYSSLGVAYEKSQHLDSAAYYYRLALKETLRSKNLDYLPSAYCKVAMIELLQGNKNESLTLYTQALAISDSTGNRQAQVIALLGFANWYLNENNEAETENCLLNAKVIANGLSDKTFYVRVLEKLCSLKKSQSQFQEALAIQGEINQVNDTLNSWEKTRVIKSLEIQFDVLEKDRKLKLIEQENQLSKITNILLLSTLIFLGSLAFLVILFLRRINKRDKQLLRTKEEIALINEQQKQLKEQQLNNEIEFKESQLTAMTLQMLQKNELMQELKERYDLESSTTKDSGVGRIINKAMNQEKDWSDFNTHFESVNRNFYSRLKQLYPDISPNELKICALIKLNLSIKEMAGILNISPDSVKTARYRLRKKLELNTEDNLTDFILNI